MTIPLHVLQFALADSLDGGITPAHPIAWHEYADEWVIVYEDGRKLRHPKSERPAGSPDGLTPADRKKTSLTARKQERHDR